jgi:AcrR family transcriptional regulator
MESDRPMSDVRYHHGDLRSECVGAAIDLLETCGDAAEVSLRAVARRVGVSAGAPYRHFADRDALMSAVAAVGYQDLARSMRAAHPAPKDVAGFAAAAVAYVRFALRRPALFQAMFAGACDIHDSDRVAAAAEIRDYVGAAVACCLPGTDPATAATTVWGLVHGLAFLHVSGKLDATDTETVDGRIVDAVHILMGISSARSV